MINLGKDKTLFIKISRFLLLINRTYIKPMNPNPPDSTEHKHNLENITSTEPNTNKVLLLILDGFGIFDKTDISSNISETTEINMKLTDKGSCTLNISNISKNQDNETSDYTNDEKSTNAVRS
ncbi:hypothetical protein CDIK_4419, partial [Cucumispora dikerogammari]